jgi:hypothetical protein
MVMKDKLETVSNPSREWHDPTLEIESPWISCEGKIPEVPVKVNIS